MQNILWKYFSIYPVRYLRGEYVGRYLKEARNIEGMNSEDLEGYQIRKVNELLKVCKNEIPFYSETLKSNPAGNDIIKSYEDLLNIPTITKDVYRDQVNKFILKSNRRISKRSTSGSTGEPLVFYKDRKASAFMDAVMFQCYSWHGINIGDRQARFWGMPISKKEKAKAILKDFLMNRIRFSAFELNKDAMEKFYIKMLKFKPSYIYGYPSLIYEFANFIEENNYKIHNFNLKGIIVTGELVVKSQLTFIENIFKAPTINEYGCTEVGVIAFQCPCKNMHIMCSNVLVEVIKGDKHVFDEEGDIVITELNSKVMPFMRYKIGDIGVLSKRRCDCGINYPVMEMIRGRSDNYIKTSTGEKIYDAIFAYTLKDGIRKFKAYQTALNQIDIDVVKEKNFTPELQKKYFEAISSALGGGMNIYFHFVDEIESTESGKFSYFESRLGRK